MHQPNHPFRSSSNTMGKWFWLPHTIFLTMTLKTNAGVAKISGDWAYWKHLLPETSTVFSFSSAVDHWACPPGPRAGIRDPLGYFTLRVLPWPVHAFGFPTNGRVKTLKSTDKNYGQDTAPLSTREMATPLVSPALGGEDNFSGVEGAGV